MFTIAIFGFGGRGKIYADNFRYLGVEVTAVCDYSEARLQIAREQYPNATTYADEKKFFAAGKLADVLVVATLDDQHYLPTVKGMELGYDIILEKPISFVRRECDGIAEIARRTGKKVTVCHVLRYAPFYAKAKALLDRGDFGKILHISMSEHVGFYHFAHSYVRGPWRNTQTSAPVILAKSCHDLDLFAWFMDCKCEKISSFGGLDHFIPENAPEGASKRCSDCKYRESCPYSCFKIYLNDEYERLAALARHGRLGGTKEEIAATLSDGKNPYGRCVYACDNNVFDHQVVNMRFENGATGQFALWAQSEHMQRTLHIICEKGEIYGKEGENRQLCYRFYGNPTEEHTIDIVYENEIYSSHGGGDMGLVKAFTDNSEVADGKMRSDIFLSLESHYMGFAAQESAENDGVAIAVEAFRR